MKGESDLALFSCANEKAGRETRLLTFSPRGQILMGMTM
jgi:hypothetical protein